MIQERKVYDVSCDNCRGLLGSFPSVALVKSALAAFGVDATVAPVYCPGCVREFPAPNLVAFQVEPTAVCCGG